MDLPTLANFAHSSCILLCNHALAHFFPNYTQFHYLFPISFVYLHNFVSSNTWLYMNTKKYTSYVIHCARWTGRIFLEVWNVQKINHGHPRKCISCNLEHPKPKTSNLRTNLSGPMKDTLFMQFSSKGKTKYWQIWYIVSNIYIVNKKDTNMAFLLSI